MGIYATSERTRLALIHAAGELLDERGLGRVSTRAIAERAGENLGAIHYHFGSKEGLLKETLRFACRSQAGPSLSEVIASYQDRLDTVSGQVAAVRRVVQYLIETIFSPDRPRWCSRVLYQVAQHDNPLRAFLREQVLDPSFEALTRLVLRVRPEWSTHDVCLWSHVLIGPAVYHADHADLILERLGCKTFPRAYLEGLERRIADDAMRALGLPHDRV
ncbi:MAG TPA: helix-turn-helix domain-containing protein [Phycisphaerae bacterium]|nr:helix-turn-helix domain-containing protein [Phycisphaerae bacterium]HOJ76130.1 helix-turn-helix domain-containing protein [Phycisphaerae bacterium]HOM53115.1 helix-turn-helix domain-containing protein [Phycisphaerae bacterium]HON66930.1 helix-turn-helix domain-containing protein [Phycisphaerae bacterium]HOQ85515.1 helix-turn-helix domain-containing protein [Phycisphaerae bacterium]